MANLARQIGYPNILLQILIAYLLFSFPFVLRNLNPGVYAVGLYALTALIPLALLISGQSLLISTVTETLRRELLLSLFVIFYAAYILILTFVSIAYFDFESLKALVLKLQVLMYVSIVILAFKKSDFERLWCYYLNLMVAFSLLGILLTILVYLKLIHPLADIRLDSDSHRDFYILGFVWPDTWIGDLIASRLTLAAQNHKLMTAGQTPANSIA